MKDKVGSSMVNIILIGVGVNLLLSIINMLKEIKKKLLHCKQQNHIKKRSRWLNKLKQSGKL